MVVVCPSCTTRIDVESGPEPRTCPDCGSSLSAADPILAHLDAAGAEHRLGPATIGERIGAGGMGILYRGVHERLGIDVAVKCLNPSLSMDSTFIARFQQEARLAARIKHQNLVSVYDVGVEHGINYIVMDFVEGDTLRRIIDRRGPLSIRRALGIMQRLAQAVAAAHDEGVIHRDIKPDNVIASSKSVVLLDLGIARAMQETTSVLTQPNTQMGSPRYMAPEQYADSSGITERSDVYACGLTLYYLLLGRDVFQSTTMPELLKEVHAGVPPASQLLPRAPEEVQAFLDRTTALQPEDRPENGRELLRAVMAVRQQTKASSARTVTLPATDRPDSRSTEGAGTKEEPVRSRGGASILMILAAVALVGFLAWQFFPGSDGPSSDGTERKQVTDSVEHGTGPLGPSELPSGLEASIDDAVRWLLNHRTPHGSWRLDEDNEEFESAVTSLAVLVLVRSEALGVGPSSRMKAAIDEGLNFVLSTQVRRRGSVMHGRVQPDSHHDTDNTIYNHTYAMLAWAESLLQQGSSRLKEPLELAVDYAFRHQKPGYGWRYEPGARSNRSDSSVTGLFILALRAAYECHEKGLIAVDTAKYENAIEDGLSFIRNVTASRGTVGYFSAGDTGSLLTDYPAWNNLQESLPTTALGAVVHRAAGNPADAERLKLHIAKHPPKWLTYPRGAAEVTHIDYYYWYWGTRAMHSPEWNLLVEALLREHQYREGSDRGSWPEEGYWSREYGQTYATCMNALTLLEVLKQRRN